MVKRSLYDVNMSIRMQIVSAAETLFDQNGMSFTGIDHIAKGADVSTRTLYKYVGSRDALVVAVLQERQRRFLEKLTANSVDGLFDNLELWIRTEGARGCLFLRMGAETGAAIPEVATVVADYRRTLRERIAALVQQDVGSPADIGLSQQVLVLFEGATTAASYCGEDAIHSARSAAAVLIAHAKDTKARQ